MTSILPRGSALRRRNFRFFWAGQTLSLIGDRMATIALALYISLELHDPTGLGIVLGAQVAGLALFLLVGGVWGDRFDRRRMIILTDLACAAMHGITAWMIFNGTASIPKLLVIETMFGIAEAVYRPAFSGLLPETVEEDEITSAWSFASASESLAVALGPAIATGLVLGFGATWAFAIDSLTFLMSAVSLTFVVPRARAAVKETAESMLVSIRDGWGEVRQRAWVWVTIASFAALLMLSLAPWFVLAPGVAHDLYGTGAVYGFHESCFGVGMILGSLVAGRLSVRRPLRTALLLMVPWPLQFISFGLGFPVALVYLAALVAGAGMGVFNVCWQASLAAWIPPERLSRVTSWDWMGSTVMMPLGYVLAGPVSRLVPAREMIVGAGVIGAICIAAALAPRATRTLGPGPASAT